MGIDDLKLRTKTLIPLVVMALAGIGMIAFGAFQLVSISGKASEIIERRDLAATKVACAERRIADVADAVFASLVYDDDSPGGRAASERFPARVEQADELLNRAMTLVPDRAAEIGRFRDRFRTLVETARMPLRIGEVTPGLEHARNLEPEELDRLAEGARLMTGVDFATHRLIDDVAEFNAGLLAENAGAAAALRAQSSLALVAMAGFGLVATLFAGFLAHWVASSKIARPLARLAQGMAALAHGDLTGVVDGQARRDEIGDMAKAVQVFKDNAVERRRLEAAAARHDAQVAATHLETRRLGLENARLANTDGLTALPNRRHFLAALNQTLRPATRDGRRFIVGLIDLDGFKSVNDLHGHGVGDRVLVETARRLRELCDSDTLVASLGGDEFGVIIDAEMNDADIQALGVRLCAVLATPLALPGILVEISGSIGFAVFPQAGPTAELLFERADYALAHAKEHQRGRPAIFSIEHEAEIRRLANMETCLRHADLETEMALHFQPIVDVSRGETVAFEALARWTSPTLGRIAPDVFIRVAERSDLINKLTAVLLRRALAEARTWPEPIHVSFNLSTRDLASREAIRSIMAIIGDSGVAPGRIDLEVTETALIRDVEQAKTALLALRAMGVGVSLDDFGTGYSSLSFVQQFPIDKIKIDRSFVREVETKPACRAIVKSVIDLCRNLQLTCIVEGMETNAQVGVLRALGCTTMQGYLFGKPMPAEAIPRFLAAADSLPRPQLHLVASLAS
ncbi:MAG: EAL domain-containing protein [Roseiarcus sp.]